MGENAAKRVREQFTWDAVARRCLAAYGAETERELKTGGVRRFDVKRLHVVFPSIQSKRP